jgi:hypothetical protein
MRDDQHGAAFLGELRMTRSTSPTSSGSSADVGSSKSITFGRIASERAIAARCCWPPENARDSNCALGRPTLASSASASSMHSAFLRR